MAALGWIMSLAEKRTPGKSDEFVAEIRKSAEKSPPDVHALWTWFYVCYLQDDNAGAFEAAKALSCAAPTDTTALWAYFSAAVIRGLPSGQNYRPILFSQNQLNETPALNNDQLAHLLACYRTLRTRRPELVGTQFIATIDAELTTGPTRRRA